MLMPVAVLALPYVLVSVVLFLFTRIRNPDGTEWSSYDFVLGCVFWPVTLIVVVVELAVRKLLP